MLRNNTALLRGARGANIAQHKTRYKRLKHPLGLVLCNYALMAKPKLEAPKGGNNYEPLFCFNTCTVSK